MCVTKINTKIKIFFYNTTIICVWSYIMFFFLIIQNSIIEYFHKIINKKKKSFIIDNVYFNKIE